MEGKEPQKSDLGKLSQLRSVEAHGKLLLDHNEDNEEGIPEIFLKLNKKLNICFLWLPSTDCCTVGLCTVLCFV